MQDAEAVPSQKPESEIASGAPLPFSKQAIWGFVIACVTLFIFGFLGIAAAALSANAFREASRGHVRGKGLAIAGMIIGTLSFVLNIVRIAMQ